MTFKVMQKSVISILMKQLQALVSQAAGDSHFRSCVIAIFSSYTSRGSSKSQSAKNGAKFDAAGNAPGNAVGIPK